MVGVRVAVLAAVLAVGLVRAGWAQDALPDPVRTPGAVDPTVTQATIGETICRRGWTRTVRPPEAFTESLKRSQILEWSYADRRLGDYEEDHLVPLELAGAGADVRNLWPEPHDAAGGWGSYRKDELENVLNRMVCEGRLALVVAQHAIATNWVLAYRRYVRRPVVYEPVHPPIGGWSRWMWP